MRITGILIVFIIMLTLVLMPGYASAVKLDKETGLVIGKGFDTVKSNCTICHSAMMITQNRMDRNRWLETIRWMQKNQGLRTFKPDTEKEILDYLSTNYAPEKAYRRPPLKVEWE